MKISTVFNLLTEKYHNTLQKYFLMNLFRMIFLYCSSLLLMITLFSQCSDIQYILIILNFNQLFPTLHLRRKYTHYSLLMKIVSNISIITIKKLTNSNNYSEISQNSVAFGAVFDIQIYWVCRCIVWMVKVYWCSWSWT